MNNFDVLFYAGLQPMWIFDLESLRILEVNNAAIKHYGFTHEEFLSKTIKDLRPAEDIPQMEAYLKDAGKPVINFREFRHVDKQGNVFYVEVMSHLMTFNNRQARLVVAQNIEERKAIMGELEFTQTRLQKILESTSIGFFQVNHDSVLTYWNRAAEELTGYRREHILGKHIWDVFTEAKNSDFYYNFQVAITRRVNIEFTEYYWPIQKWFTVSAYPVNEGLIVHFRDVTANKLSEEKLLKKIEQLKDVSFINSHYIRKPVASLLGLTNLINEELITEGEFREIAKHIAECSQELDTVVRDINSRVNDDDHFIYHLSDEMELFSVTALCRDLAESYTLKSGTHQVLLEADGPRDYYGHRANISAAIKCLVDNAIRFSPGGSHVIITLREIDQNLVISVQDFGIGINTQLINKIFLSFIRTEVARGLGAGLARASEIARKHNGDIWVESKPGEGSTFSMRLPLSNFGVETDGSNNFSVYKDPAIEIQYYKEPGYILADWKGFQSFHSVKKNCYKMLEWINTHRVEYLLNDNSNLMGTWGDAVEWVASEFLPLLEKAGVKRIAWIYSPSTFNRLAVNHTISDLKTGMTIKTFDNKAEAIEWLTATVVIH